MRRVILAMSACAMTSLALTASAQAASLTAGASATHRPANAAKSAKPKDYEFCGSEAGCGFTFEFFSKTKTVDVDGESLGTYITGKKGLLEIKAEVGCDVILHKVKKTKNYSGEEPAGQAEGCYIQTVTLTYL